MTILKKFQKRAVRQMEKFNGRVLNASEMGLGKSLETLAYMVENDIKTTIIICPAGLKYHWREQAAMHYGRRAEILSTTKPKREAIKRRHSLVIVNYDILTAWMPFLKSLRADLVVVDEIHYVKTRSTIRSKQTKKLCRLAKHVIGLSGTPLTSRPSELWNPIHIIRPDLFPDFIPYAFRYCAPRKRRWGWEFKGARHLDELHQILKSELMIRDLKKDALQELPAKTRTVISVDVPGRKEYDYAEKEFASWLQKNIGQIAAHRTLRAERLVRHGHLKRLAGKLKLPIVMSWIDDFLEQSDDKLIVFGVHKKIVREIHDRFRKISVIVNGEVTGRKRQIAVEQFQKTKKCRIFVGNIDAAGVGWNGSCASTVMFAELTWTPGQHTQAEDRPHRIGQEGNVQIYYLVARNTVEEDLCKLLQSKQENINHTLDGRGRGAPLDILDKLQKSILRRQS